MDEEQRLIRESYALVTKAIASGKFSVNTRYHDGYTLVHLIFKQKQPQLDQLERYLKHSFEKPNLNLQTTKYGHTALHIACLSGKKDAVQLLLREGADPTIVDRCEATPICYATSHYDCFMLLVKFRPDLVNHISSKRRLSLLQNTCRNQNGSLGVVQFLCGSATTTDIDYKTIDGRTALSFCIANGKREMALELLLHGAQLALAIHGLKTPLPEWAITMALQVKDQRIQQLQQQVDTLFEVRSERKKRRVDDDDE
jgi:ankyrin repeat protein